MDHLPESTRREMEIHEQKVKDFELKRKMRSTVVPTDDAKVREQLRQIAEPVTLFGEREVRISTNLVACKTQQNNRTHLI